ncbi:MBL fold metallo-hydrolase [Saccharopolyspora cebuensis]|uniref:MBL fold metallo-hydrolase n=1 Tax=Saccharopolyspora cebuensis TaxID=418759 RepID=A0ABV4CGD8_9PSEU
MSWQEIAAGVLVRRHDELDLTTGLVLGTGSAVVVDTGGDEVRGAGWAEEVRGITALPVQVVLTHAHFDHCFGTAAFRPAPVWAHAGFPAHLARTAEPQRAHWSRHYRERGETALAAALEAARPVEPDRLVRDGAELDLGDRRVRLHHLGPGHTDHDLVVEVPDAAVVFAGDLVEQGGPPDFEDADPLRWPTAVDRLLALAPEVVVPGHGTPVDAAFARAQREDLAALAALCSAVAAGSLPRAAAVARSPFPASTTTAALDRVR